MTKKINIKTIEQVTQIVNARRKSRYFSDRNRLVF